MKTLSITNRLALRLTLLAMVASSCEKDVGRTNPTAAVQGGTEAGSNSGDANANDLDALKKKLEDASTKFQNELAEYQKSNDAKNKEQDDRLSAIEKRLADLSALLKSEIARIDLRINTVEADLKAKLEDLKGQFQALDARVVKLETVIIPALTADIAGLKVAIEAIKVNITNIQNDMKKAQDDIKALQVADTNFDAKLKAAIDDYNKKITDLTNLEASHYQTLVTKTTDLTNALETERKKLQLQIDALKVDTAGNTTEINLLKARMTKVESDIAGIKTDVSGLKTDLAVQKKYLEDKILELKTQTDLALIALDKKIVAVGLDNLVTKQELEAARLALIKAQQESEARLQAQINGLSTDIQNLKKTLASVNDDIKQLYANDAQFGLKLTQAVLQFQQGMQALANQIASEVNLLRFDMNRQDQILQAQILNLRLNTEQAQKTLQDQINGLRADQTQQRLDLMKALNDLAASEVEARAVIQKKIDELGAEISRVAKLAQSAVDMSLLDRAKIAALQADLNAFKVSFQQQIDDMKNNFQAKLNALSSKVDAVAQDLGVMKAQLVDVTGRLAQAEARIQALGDSIAYLFLNIVKTGDQVAKLQAILEPYYNKVEIELNSVILFAHMVERDMIDVGIDPVLKSVPGVNVADLNVSFKAAVANDCKNQGDFEGTFGQVLGFEWFYQVSRVYAQDLVYGARSGNAAIDKIFFGKTSIIVDTGLNAKLMTGALLSFSVKASPACDKAVAVWSRDILYGNNAQSAAIRDAIAKSALISKNVGELFNAIARMNTQSTDFMKTLVAFLTPFMGSEAAVVSFLTGSVNNGPSILSQLALVILDKANEVKLALLLADQRDTMVGMAMDIKKLADQQQKTTANVTALQAAVVAMNAAIADLAKSQKQIAANVAGLTAAEIVSLNLIATIAQRLGYADLIEIARQQIEALGGTLSIYNSVNSCMAASHFYLHSPYGSGKATQWCNSMISKSDKPVLDDLALTQCASHGTGVNGTSYTFGNTFPTTTGNGWELYGRTDPNTGLQIVNGLLMSYVDTDAGVSPENAGNKALLARRPGAYPADNRSVFALRVLGGTGAAAGGKFKISVRSISNASWDPYDVIVGADQFKVGPDASKPNSFVYELPLPKAVTRLGGCTWNKEITVWTLDAAGNQGAQACKHRIHTFSPIVLDLSGGAMVSTISPNDSHVKFDLDANGIQDNTGWISGKSGLLAIDRNGNGKIDDGSELFGEATDLVGQPGKKAANGYAAMAQFDTNHDGVLNAQDRIWNKLVVWVDANGDGKSQPIEMKTMKQLGINKIEVNFTEVASKDVIQTTDNLEGNLVKYTAKFYGPEQCGNNGCKSYDVYFGSSESMVVGASK